MTYLIVMLCVFIKDPGKALIIGAMFYFGLLLTFMITYMIDQIQFLSTLTPFYWIDRIRILYEQNIILDDILAILLYLVVMSITFYVSNKKIIEREFF